MDELDRFLNEVDKDEKREAAFEAWKKDFELSYDIFDIDAQEWLGGIVGEDSLQEAIDALLEHDGDGISGEYMALVISGKYAASRALMRNTIFKIIDSDFKDELFAYWERYIEG